MKRLDATAKQHKAAADRANQLRAQLASLADVGERNALEAADDDAATAAQRSANREHDLDTSYRALAEQIPVLRGAAEQAAESSLLRADAHERQTRAKHQAATYASSWPRAAATDTPPPRTPSFRLSSTAPRPRSVAAPRYTRTPTPCGCSKAGSPRNSRSSTS